VAEIFKVLERRGEAAQEQNRRSGGCFFEFCRDHLNATFEKFVIHLVIETGLLTLAAPSPAMKANC
jgi:hypothetical protein